MKTEPTEFNQLNSSPSKMRYTFAKEERFKEQGCKTNSGFYELPSVRETRAAGFGYGTKYDIGKQMKESPSPQRYNINSIFEEAKGHKKGYPFGEGRDIVKVSGARNEENTPGPGKYEKNSTLSKVSYSMRQKQSLPSLHATPGPGTYETPTALDKNGNYFQSKMKNSLYGFINPEPNKKKPKNPLPGPGSYDITNVSIQNNGNIRISQCSNSRSFHFPHENRSVFSNNQKVPGPGTYERSSDFGSLQNSSYTPKTKPPR